MSVAPKVSVLIPTYNYAHFLDETIQSVLNQTFGDFELIIVDDVSNDNTDQVVSNYLSDPRVFYYKNDKNLGLVGNWNKCLTYAKGEYIKFLCADDKFNSQLLEKFVAIMEMYPNVSLVTSYKEEFGKNGNNVQTWALPLKELHTGKEIIKNTLYTYGWLGEPSAVMFRRCNLKVGAFDPDFIWLPDWEMWLRQLTVGDCYIIPEPLSRIRNHSGQVTKKVMRGYINYFEEYRLCKDLKTGTKYKVDLSDIDIDDVIKQKATKCAKAAYKVLPELYKKENRKIFSKAFKIALNENVLFSPIVNALRKKRAINKSLKQITPLHS